MAFKLTKQQEKDLKKLAASLPPCKYQAFAGTISGADLLKEFPALVADTGTEVIPGKMYKRPVYLDANHFKRLKQVYKDGGNPAVEKYINQVLGPEKPVENE